MARKWSLKLECGHWLAEQSAADRDRIVDTGEAVCAKCGPTSPTGALRYGGLTQRQTERKLERARGAEGKWEEHLKANPYRHMPDGLIVIAAPPSGFRWWCHECDGKNPDAWRKGGAGTLEEVERMWSEHKANPSHLERFGYVAALSDERLALAADRVNLTRKPPPPKRTT